MDMTSGATVGVSASSLRKMLVPLALAGLYTLGTTVLFGLAFNYANVIAVPLLMGIGVAFDIYFAMLWRAGNGPVALLQTPTARAVLFSALRYGLWPSITAPSRTTLSATMTVPRRASFSDHSKYSG